MCLSAMHLKFPVAAELVATIYSLSAGNREKKATTHVFFKKKKKGKKLEKRGEIIPSAGVYLCLLQSSWCLAESPSNPAGCCGVHRASSRVQVAAPGVLLFPWVLVWPQQGLVLLLPCQTPAVSVTRAISSTSQLAPWTVGM